MKISTKQAHFKSQLGTFAIAVILVAMILLNSFSTQASPTLADYGQLPSVQNMAISPSGERLAYRRTNADGDLIVIYSNKEKKVLTGLDVSKSVPRDIFFINENEIIMVVSNFDRIDGFLGEHKISAAYVFNIKKKKLKLLLAPGKIVYRGQTGLGNIYGVSKDRKHVYLGAYSGERLSSQAKANYKYALLDVKISNPRRPSYHANGSIDTIDFFLGEDDEALIDERYNQDSNEHSILVKQDRKWKVIYSAELEIRTVVPVGLASDYRSLVVLKYNENSDRVSYYLMDLEDGSLTLSDMSRKDADIEFVLTDINRLVHGVAYSGFNLSYQFIDKKLDERMNAILEQFPDHTVTLESWSPDWKSIVVFVEGPYYPGDFYLFTSGKDPSFITTARPNISPDAINPIAELSYNARDGLKIPTILTIPQNKLQSMKNLPAVILPHGGPEDYDPIAFDWLAQAIASRGYLVVQPQFRGSTGFGWSYRKAGFGEWGKKMQNDLSDGVAFLTEKGIINPSKVCIVGLSYGGYAALAGGAFTPELYACVASINGIGDLNAMLSSTEFRFGSGHTVLSYWERLVANNKTNKKDLAEISPINFVDNFTAPTLLIHSERDTVVKKYQSEDMYSALKSSDKPVSYVQLEDESHYLETNQGRLKALNELIEFLDSHLVSQD